MNRSKCKDWQTTVGGWLAGLGTVSAAALSQMGLVKWVPIALAVSGFGQIVAGHCAADREKQIKLKLR